MRAALAVSLCLVACDGPYELRKRAASPPVVERAPAVEPRGPAGDAIEIDDVIVSSDDATDVEIFFSPPKFLVMKLYLDANESVSTNLQGQVEGEKDQGLKMSCGGVATVSVTIAGSRVGL